MWFLDLESLCFISWDSKRLETSQASLLFPSPNPSSPPPPINWGMGDGDAAGYNTVYKRVSTGHLCVQPTIAWESLLKVSTKGCRRWRGRDLSYGPTNTQPTLHPLLPQSIGGWVMGMVLELSPNNHCLDVETAVNLSFSFRTLSTTWQDPPIPLSIPNSGMGGYPKGNRNNY